MKTRIVHTKIWEDEWFYSLSRDARELFLYVLTNQRINLSGMYQLPDRVILSDTKIGSDGLQTAKQELLPKVIFYESWVYIKNAEKLSNFSGSKNEIAKQKELNDVPTTIFNYLFNVDNSVDNSSILDKKDTLLSTSDRVFGVENSSSNKKLEIRNKNTGDSVSGFEKLKTTVEGLR